MINRRHKDAVFRDLFGAPERRDYALSLHNALAGTTYAGPTALGPTTLDDASHSTTPATR